MQSRDKGYGLNNKGEGCFRLLALKFETIDFDVMVEKEIEPKLQFKNRETDGAKFLIKNVFQYTLILPSAIGASSFCKAIYGYLYSCLK